VCLAPPRWRRRDTTSVELDAADAAVDLHRFRRAVVGQRAWRAAARQPASPLREVGTSGAGSRCGSNQTRPRGGETRAFPSSSRRISPSARRVLMMRLAAEGRSVPSSRAEDRRAARRGEEGRARRAPPAPTADLLPGDVADPQRATARARRATRSAARRRLGNLLTIRHDAFLSRGIRPGRAAGARATAKPAARVLTRGGLEALLLDDDDDEDSRPLPTESSRSQRRCSSSNVEVPRLGDHKSHARARASLARPYVGYAGQLLRRSGSSGVNHHTVLNTVGVAPTRTFLFINVFFLLCIAFIPFSDAAFLATVCSGRTMGKRGPRVTLWDHAHGRPALLFNLMWR